MHFSREQLIKYIDAQKGLKVVIFNRELGDLQYYCGDVNSCWLLGRAAVAHELGHIIFPDRDNKYINIKLIELGFTKEFERAQKEKDEEFKNPLINTLKQAQQSLKLNDKQHGKT